jgi:hypothetical protein
MFAGKTEAYPSEVPFRCSTLPTNIRLGWKSLPGTNTLAYYKNPQITAVISFIVQGHVSQIYCHIFVKLKPGVLRYQRCQCHPPTRWPSGWGLRPLGVMCFRRTREPWVQILNRNFTTCRLAD